MKFLPVFLVAMNMLLSIDTLSLYNTTEWRAIATFNGNYVIYKPVCAGRYKLGDLISQGAVSAASLANYFVCVDGPSTEIVEATTATYVRSSEAALLTESYQPSATYYVTGIVSMDQKAWKKVDKKWNGDVSSVPDLRGYGALIHPKCQLTACTSTAVQRGPTTFRLFNALSSLSLSQGQSMPLFLVDGSGLTTQCLTLDCMCPTCVHGTCNPVTGKCACDPKWRGNDCDQDVNECDLHTDNCDPIGTCANQSPGFTCSCPSGYNTTDGGVTCNDINECSIPMYIQECLGKNTTCVNYVGGYQCTNCLEGQIFSAQDGVCKDISQVFKCGNRVLGDAEECDRGIGCSVECTCNTGFSAQNSTDCLSDCGNGVIEGNEECDSGQGCLSTCTCDEQSGFTAVNLTSCRSFEEIDACARFTECSDCTAFSCLYCSYTGRCATNRIGSDCSDVCPTNSTDPLIIEPFSATTRAGIDDGTEMRTVVPVVVLVIFVVSTVALVLVFLYQRRQKKKKETVRNTITMSRINSRRRSTANTSKYGLERTTMEIIPDTIWMASPESRFSEMDHMPFEISKSIDFNLGNNQFKVGQQYTDFIKITAKDKKSASGGGYTFSFHPPKSKKLTMEFIPASGIVKKNKPVEVEVSLTMNMTTEINIDIGVECASEKKHSFITLNVLSELSSFLDLDEVSLEGGSGAKPIGDGAFGVVYKGKFRGQEVAVKMLRVQDLTEYMLDEFDREVDLMNKLRHKNIVQFIGASKVVGRLALLTEFIEGGNMSKVLFRPTRVSYLLKLRIALDTALALLFLHENRVLHRDIKLDNVLCVSTDQNDPVVAKLTDFGASRAVSEKASNSYTTGVGTPLYMSPEVLSKKPYDTKSDVYSYGVMLWVLYCQREPYSGIAHSWDIAQFVIDGNREKIPRDCPQEYHELIERCWAPNPRDRPEFNEIVKILEDIIQLNKNSAIKINKLSSSIKNSKVSASTSKLQTSRFILSPKKGSFN